MQSSSFTDNYGVYAGAIETGSGSLTVQNSIFSGNIARSSLNATTAGGAIFVGAGTAEITSSAFLNNVTGGQGGAVVNYAAVTMTNCTIYGNGAGEGGAIVNGLTGDMELTNCTLYGNISDLGGISNYGTMTLRNTIVAGSTSQNCRGPGALTDGGYNIEDSDTCGFTSGNYSLANTNPLLSSPGKYSGNTWTVALLPNSPAIDMIPHGTNGCGTDVTVDQRGIQRPQGADSRCDAGAFESQGFTVQKISGGYQTSGNENSFAFPLRLVVSSRYGEPVANGQITFSGPKSGASTKPVVNTASISSSGSAAQLVVGNGIPGQFSVTGSATGIYAPVYYNLTNAP